LAVEIRDIIRHVGLLEQLVCRPREHACLLGVRRIVGLAIFDLFGAKLQEGVDELSVEAGDQLRQEVELADGGYAVRLLYF
jgi:hypothetical protein